MVLQNNIPGLNSKRIYNKNSSKLAKSLEKLSSGYSINRAGDDSAGLAVSEKMRSQICGMKQSVKNCQDGISLIQTFEGALGETVAIIKRMKSLASQIANGTYDDNIDRNAVEIEYCSLKQEVDQIADTDFNGIVMLNGRRMADKFTFLTEDGIKWLTPSKVEFPEDTFISTFKPVPDFPEIEMSIELLPEAKAKMVDDKELMLAFEKLNEASVRSFYNHGIPEFSLEDLKPEDMSKFSIETTGSSAIISAYTSRSGKVDIARVECTELPHYASTSATGLWVNGSVIASSYYSPTYPSYKTLDTSPDGSKSFDPNEWTKGFVDGSTATRAQREAYDAWILATPRSSATLVPDNDFNNDTDPLKFIWSLDNSEWENVVDSNGVPTSTSGVSVPVYGQSYQGGPQVNFTGLRFSKNDEDMKAGASLTLSVVALSSRLSTSSIVNENRESYVGGSHSLTSGKYYNMWLDHGASTVTLTYNKTQNTWSDNFGGTGTAAEYGISDRHYNYAQSLIDRDPYYRRLEARNLYHAFEADGKLPDGFTLSFRIEAPNYRSWSNGGLVWDENRDHAGYSASFAMGEFDPENPDAGGVDYTIAQHGAVYTFDGTYREYAEGVDPTVPTDPNDPDSLPKPTVSGAWKNEAGEVVDLAQEGIILPKKPNPDNVLTIHDGMKITVSNPTMVGQDYIQAKIRLFDEDRGVNAYRRIYENITYSDKLILQTGARTKDAVDFTFSYNAGGIGGLNADLDCTAQGLGLDELTLKTQEKANFAIDRFDYALNKVSMIRATFGAAQNRLEHKIDNLNNTTENLTAAESRIRDTDMAKEMMNFTKQQILTQSSQSMLSQANSLPQQVLSLLDA